MLGSCRTRKCPLPYLPHARAYHPRGCGLAIVRARPPGARGLWHGRAQLLAPAPRSAEHRHQGRPPGARRGLRVTRKLGKRMSYAAHVSLRRLCRLVAVGMCVWVAGCTAAWRAHGGGWVEFGQAQRRRTGGVAGSEGGTGWAGRTRTDPPSSIVVIVARQASVRLVSNSSMIAPSSAVQIVGWPSFERASGETRQSVQLFAVAKEQGRQGGGGARRRRGRAVLAG